MCIYDKMVDRYIAFVERHHVQSPSCHAVSFSASQETPRVLLPCLQEPDTRSYSEPT